jgi:chromosome partitioning protein
MQRILVINSKGGCGKSTLATNVAGWLAYGRRVTLADFDEQRTSFDWTRLRPADRPVVQGLRAWKRGLDEVDPETDVVVLDAPARLDRKEMKSLVRHADSVLVPMLPSMIDMRAAERFMEDLLDIGRIERRQVRVGLVANRVRERTLMSGELLRFIDAFELPFLGPLREAQAYVHAYGRGLGVLELPRYRIAADLEQWLPILRWIEAGRPKAVTAGRP